MEFFKLLIGYTLDELFKGANPQLEYYAFQGIMKQMITSSWVLAACPHMEMMRIGTHGAKILQAAWSTKLKTHNGQDVLHYNTVCIGGHCTEPECIAEDPSEEELDEYIETYKQLPS